MMAGVQRVSPNLRPIIASNAMLPPSPSLSARRMMKTYLTVTTDIMVQKISDSTP